MRISGLWSTALTLFLAIVIGVGLERAAAAPRVRWILASASACNCLDWFPAEGHHVKIKGMFYQPIFSQAIDRNRTLYVNLQLTNRKYGVEEFPPRGAIPSLVFAVPGFPTALAVKPDGTLFISGSKNDVLVYAPGAKKPSGIIRLQNGDIRGQITALHFSARTGILYINLYIDDSSIHDYSDVIFEALPGSHIATGQIGIPFGSSGHLDVDQQDRLIVSMRNGVAVYCRNPWRRCRFLAFDTGPAGVTYDPESDRLYVGRAADLDIGVYNYTTGLLVDKIESGFAADYITLSPVQP